MIVKVLLILLLAASTVQAQTVSADRIRLNTGPCIVTSQAGPPVRLVFTGSCDGITNASGNFELNPAGDLVINPAGKDILPTLGYDINLGSLQKKLLAIHAAELWIETIVAQNTIGTIGGRVLVAPTNLLTADLASGGTTITVKYNNLANGDRTYMEADGKVEFFAITSAAGGSAGAYTYSVTRNLDGSGANDWFAGDAMLNTGQTGNGFIDLYSVRGVKAGTEIGPSIVFNQRLSSTYNDWAPRGAVGQLDGLYGYSGSTYGAAFGNPSATNVTVDATNGFRIRSGTTNKLVADTSGNLSIVGDLTVGTSGVIRSGATDYSSGVGWIMEYNGGTPRMRIGNPAGNRMTWDGSTLSIVGTHSGDGSGVTNINGGNIQTDTITATQIAANAITTSELNADSVTSAKIVAGTIVASDIAALTITANEIAANTITAGKLNVTTLSAITANLGTVTAGHINGATAEFGGGALDLNSSGLTLTAGVGTSNQIKWSDGSTLYSNSDVLTMDVATEIQLLGGSSGGVYISSSALHTSGTTMDLGKTSSGRWRDLYLSNNIYLDGDFDWTPPTTTSSDQPVVYSVGNGILYRKTNGHSGTCNSNITVQGGIITGCTP